MRQAGEVTYADAHKEPTHEGVSEDSWDSDVKRALDNLDGTGPQTAASSCTVPSLNPETDGEGQSEDLAGLAPGHQGCF